MNLSSTFGTPTYWYPDFIENNSLTLHQLGALSRLVEHMDAQNHLINRTGQPMKLQELTSIWGLPFQTAEQYMHHFIEQGYVLQKTDGFYIHPTVAIKPKGDVT